MTERNIVSDARRWVVKIGSSLLTTGGNAMADEQVMRWCAQLAELRQRGIEVAVVSSGAVAAGMLRRGLRERPQDLAALQAAAALGQLGVAGLWERCLDAHALQAAQILLTHEDAVDRARFLNARNTLRVLLDWGVVPVINENDTVATDEIRFGDNDTLAALAADLVSADLLVILTDQPGLFTADPRRDPGAELVSCIDLDAAELSAMAGSSKGSLGRGGMQTKLQAARLAARSGISTVIAGGQDPDILTRLADGQALGSLLRASGAALPARKRWIAAQARCQGELSLDAGAVRALREGGRSLLPVGVQAVRGRFARGDLVACLDPEGAVIARGLSNYAAVDASRLCGISSDQIVTVLGQPGEPELIHRDNLVLANH